jgi:pimeloyl-ACP methyl ester carboxylesterase
VDIGGGMSMHIHCQGTGSPVVVLEAGSGGGESTWSQVQPDIARFTRVCAYDRVGIGRSSRPAPRPHSLDQAVGELHSLLAGAGVPPPYVLVGHSLGGVYVRLFASAHPDEVAGMVLIDVATEEQPSRFWALLPDAALNEFRAQVDSSPEGFDYETLLAGLAELQASRRSLGDKPLIVLTAGHVTPNPGASPEQTAKQGSAWHDMQAELTRLSKNSAQVIAVNSGHFIQLDAPKLVIAAVRQVVDAVRTHGRVDGDTLEPLASEEFTL